MNSFMEWLTGKRGVSPAQSAKDRLKFVLVTDRTTLSPEELRLMQLEILEVIRKYCRVNEDNVDIKLEQRERDSYLVADIPLTPSRSGETAGKIRLETSIITEPELTDEDTVVMIATASVEESPSPPALADTGTAEDKPVVVIIEGDTPPTAS
jgi:cell division topological specificity factor